MVALPCSVSNKSLQCFVMIAQHCWIYEGGKMSTREAPGGNFRGLKCPEGNTFWGKMSGGETSNGDYDQPLKSSVFSLHAATTKDSMDNWFFFPGNHQVRALYISLILLLPPWCRFGGQQAPPPSPPWLRSNSTLTQQHTQHSPPTQQPRIA